MPAGGGVHDNRERFELSTLHSLADFTETLKKVNKKALRLFNLKKNMHLPMPLAQARAMKKTGLQEDQYPMPR
jgi:hypothetical protein